ncbi:MAG: alpha/beta fold hydrolase [Janthinobacterium lividum]
MSPTSNFRKILNRELHYTEWGNEEAPVAVLWHGFARTGRDMDDLAQQLASRWRVICPDTIGRGYSQWSPLPESEYRADFYIALAGALLDELGVEQCAWVGTSMGGKLGLVAAGGPLKGRITRLVLNDIGPEGGAAVKDRIVQYIANPPTFETFAEFEAYMRTIYKPYGWQSDAQWRRMTETSSRRLPDGKLTLHYDPKIVKELAEQGSEAQWDAWDNIDVPTLVLRGVDSDVLLPETAQAMTQRGPQARLVVIEGCGHAPALNVPEQTNLIDAFLAEQ